MLQSIIMNIILFEDRKWNVFLPLAYTRPVGELRMGMMTMRERYSRIFNMDVYHDARPLLRELYPTAPEGESLHINARLIPTSAVVDAIKNLPANHAIRSGEILVAHRSKKYADITTETEFEGQLRWMDKITDMFALNAEAMKYDFTLMPKLPGHSNLHPSNVVIGDPALLYIAPDAKVYASTLNTLDGPIYIDSGAEVMEGTHIRGPFYLGEHATLKMATKVYGATTIGPHCKVGGEISNCVIQGYSNKAHDGFIGNSIIGEWCNLGADTNTSNLKNNYSSVRHWSYALNNYTDTGLTFCGLIMGDHSKCGINTMFNTGTVTGVCANIYGGDFPSKHIPSFSWGGSEGFVEYDFAKAIDTIRKVMARRDIILSAEMINLLRDIQISTVGHRENQPQSQE